MAQQNWVRVAVRKTSKAGVSASGDSVDVVERARGGLSVIMADGQGSGPAAKRISNWVVARAAALIAEGARDGAVARAVHDNLLALRGGKIVCTLAIMSVDLNTNSLVISRNGNSGALIFERGGLPRCLDEEVPPIGVHQFTKPAILEKRLHPGDCAAIFTDGIYRIQDDGGSLELDMLKEQMIGAVQEHPPPSVETFADSVFTSALQADGGRPKDDMSLAAITVEARGKQLGEAAVRSIDLKFPY